MPQSPGPVPLALRRANGGRGGVGSSGRAAEVISFWWLVAIVIGLSLVIAFVGYGIAWAVLKRGTRRTGRVAHRVVLENAGTIATVGGAILAVAALLTGLVTYKLTTQYQNRAEANSAFQSYAAMRVEHPRPKPRLKADNGELNDTYGWVALQAFAASETIYLANPGDDGWVATAQEIIDEDEDDLVSQFATDDAWKYQGWFKCKFYNPDFISEVVKPRLGDRVCKWGP